jgi:hypothetical protein
MARTPKKGGMQTSSTNDIRQRREGRARREAIEQEEAAAQAENETTTSVLSGHVMGSNEQKIVQPNP